MTKLDSQLYCRPRGPEHPLHRRVRRRQDREHQEGDPVPGLRGSLQAQDGQPPPHLGKRIVLLNKVAAKG